MGTKLNGLFLCEGTSDIPLAGIIEDLFFEAGVDCSFTVPDFSLLPRLKDKTLTSKIEGALKIMSTPPEIIAIHRDADRDGRDARIAEMQEAMANTGLTCPLLPVIPVRMTEAWILLSETEIRKVSGNPRGRVDLKLPGAASVERMADPKDELANVLKLASELTGRRSDALARRFSENRRLLLERLDIHGPVTQTQSWTDLVRDIEEIALSHTRSRIASC